MMTAAGGAALNVEEVFSTYLHTGNDDKQGIPNGIALADGVGGGTSTEFDGVSDFLSRSSDLTGNADGKTFTLSCWVYRTGAVPLRAVYPFRYQGYFQLEVGTNGAINVGGANTSGSTILEATLPSKTVPLKVWTHILVSVDLSNTSNRHIYLNDVAASPTWVTYSNQDIDFTRTTSHINSNSVGSFGSARHAHIYLDYTYRDLSVTSNRRYFIDANGGSTSPSTLSALNPIVYLPMTSAYSIGENLGTGGDYTVNGSPKVVQSGTEYLSDYGKGGLVWLKSRGFTNTNTNLTGSHALIDTERGNTSRLLSNTTDAAQSDGSNYVNSFNSDGFTVGTTMSNGFDGGHRYASWTFRKAPKFFDVVTYTGDGTAGKTVSHNLGSVPGMIIVKRTDGSADWNVYHRSLNVNGDNAPETDLIYLNLTAAAFDYSPAWNDTAPTSTEFTLGSNTDVNASGGTYVAYLFAHNDGDGNFGPTGDQDIIKCGSYAGLGTETPPEISLGFEPQWMLVKNITNASDWFLVDTMRGWGAPSTTMPEPKGLSPNRSYAEATTRRFGPTATGFMVRDYHGDINLVNNNYIYIAIRRGPMAVPESATDVFAVDSSPNSNKPRFISGFPVDMALSRKRTSTGVDGMDITSRLTQGKYMRTGSTNAESSSSTIPMDYMNGFDNDGDTATDFIAHMWKRAPSFFDVVAYTGTGSATTINHNLGVAPEMMWIKKRDFGAEWVVYHQGLDATAPEDYFIRFATSAREDNINRFNDTAPTSSVFTVNNNATVNTSGGTYIAYLFASLDGISKVGSYTGDGTLNRTIDCGFSGGPRFVLIKRADGIGGWFVFDSVRGINAGSNDPWLQLESNSPEGTYNEYLDPHTSGFIVGTSTISKNTFNSNTVLYIFYAIA